MDINVRLDSDLCKCHITGVTTLSNNRLVCLDCANCNVKLFDFNSRKLLSSLQTETPPFDVAITVKDQIAATLPKVCKVLLINVTDTLTIQREITLNGHCNGVACSWDHLLVTFVDVARIDVIDMSGNLIKTIRNGSDVMPMFQHPWYVGTSMDGETIYVSDWVRRSVTSLTLNGDVNAVYRSEDPNGPTKPCADFEGNVYFGCTEGRKVRVLKPDFTTADVILSEKEGLELGAVYSVMYCKYSNRLFVGMQRNDTVRVCEVPETAHACDRALAKEVFDG